MQALSINKKQLLNAILNSYSQIFFSTNRTLSVLLILVSFFDVITGLSGLLAIITGLALAYVMEIDKSSIENGLYGFNNLLVGLGLGLFYEFSLPLMVIVVFASLLTSFITFGIQGILLKYKLPYLSIPFLIALWITLVATGSFSALGLSAKGIYTYNEVFAIGGIKLVNLYNTIDNAIPQVISTYFKSLGAIFFQYNVIAGVVISIGLLIYSRIMFSLSLIGYFFAVLIYKFFGIDINTLSYSYIGFNYILSSIAIGGYFLQPSRYTYLAALLVIPIVILLSFSAEVILGTYYLPAYSLPFNMIVLLFIYTLRFRTNRPKHLHEIIVQQETPEKNVYLLKNYVNRMRAYGIMNISLPVMGEWNINQGHSGKITHKGDWRHAFDFVIIGNDGKEFQNEGYVCEDYYCYDKSVLAAADGYVVEINKGIKENLIGDMDINHNWGNSIVIQHILGLCTQVSHLQSNSINVKVGDFVQKGQVIAKVGNSGRSPYPHLHFQVQSAPHIGATTLDYPLCNYLSREKTHVRYHAHGIPQTNEKISNVVSTPIIANAFNFLPGQRYTFQLDFEDNDCKEFCHLDKEYSFVVHSDIYKNTYFLCEKTQAKAWFFSDGQVFYFSNYQGNKNSFLYYFMLALFKVELGFSDEIVIKDQVPPHFLYSKRKLFFQDFIAPFHHYLNATFKLEFVSIDDEMAPEEVRMKSQILASNNMHTDKLLKHDIKLTDKGIDYIQLKSEKGSFMATHIGS